MFKKQFVRYVLVGVLSNALLYLGYLFLTAVGMEHKTAMTLLYILGVLQTFIFNRKWTFSHNGPTHKALIRYLISYFLGYLINLFVLIMLVDQHRLPHEIVQGCMIIFLAILLFALQKFWVFPKTQPYTNGTEVRMELK